MRRSVLVAVAVITAGTAPRQIQTGLVTASHSAQVSGEDLTPYREASKAVWALLRDFGTTQRGGLDEAFLDATDEVQSPCSHDVTC
jgi:impB/mucB/samB family